jgi:hypothetical protein
MGANCPESRGAIKLLPWERFAPKVTDMCQNYHATVIRTLGGRAVVADALGLNRESVKSWSDPQRGIPARHWHRVVELAQGRIPGLTVAALAQTKPSVAQAAVCEAA